MKAWREVGPGRIMRFVWTSLLLSILRRMWLPPLRAACLRLFGAAVGPDVVIHRLSLINVDRGGFRSLSIGANCFIGDEVLIDLAAPVTLEDHVTLAARSVILTHLNVGYRDHPLQAKFPAETAGVRIARGSFIGAGATVLAGVTIGPEAFVGAASLVNRSVAEGETVGGVPIRGLGVRPGSDQGQTGVKPGSDQGQTEV
jgi:UDP-2-acetamido-3-amino-2,3-dideoxy-glucuronate N-acetyltransferase